MTSPFRPERCERCKWWIRDRDADIGWGVCTRATSTMGEPDLPYVNAFAVDSEEYAAGLMTHREFGCVAFEVGVPSYVD